MSAQEPLAAVEERPEEAAAAESAADTGQSPAVPMIESAHPGGPSSGAPEQHRLLLPVDTLREAAPYLRRPFTVKAIQWKVQSAFKAAGFLAVGYIDARLVVDRLNVVCPHIWQEEIEPLPSGLYLCRLTVGDTTHVDIGEGTGLQAAKAGYSDSFKRAAVKFGIGVSVYKIPRAEIWVSDDTKSGYYTYKFVQGSGNKKDQHIYRLTSEGEQALRRRYEQWLELSGIPTYGEPIDHGDVEDSAGGLADEGRGDPNTEPTTSTDLSDIKQPLTDEKAFLLQGTCRSIYEQVDKRKLPKARFESELRQASVSHDELEAFAARLREMAG